MTPDRVVVNVDGGARGNPGPAAIAAVVTAPTGEVLESRGEVIGRATNNVAEYRALLLGIERARELGAREVELVGDSELIVKQVKGEYRVKDPGLRPLHAEVRAALDGVRPLVDPSRAARAQHGRRPPRQRNARRGGRLTAAPVATAATIPSSQDCLRDMEIGPFP